jgi:hypothetical protein
MVHIVEIESLGNHAMVVPDNTMGSKYIHIHDRSEWPDYFQTMLLPPDPTPTLLEENNLQIIQTNNTEL